MGAADWARRRTDPGWIDKFFNFFTNWEMYLNPLVPRLLHIQPSTFMHVVGIVEMLVAIAVLTHYTRYAAYVAMVPVWCIAISLIAQWAFLDVAVRDMEISPEAFALVVLSKSEAAAEMPEGSSHLRVTERPAA